MAPKVHAVRHAQALHNLSHENHAIFDPRLTDLGRKQCADLQNSFPFHAKVDLIVASPLRRTIQTALESFRPVFESHPYMKVIALPGLQETSNEPCDTGNKPAILQEEFAGKPVDWTLVHEGWNSKEGIWAPQPRALKERARAARCWLKARTEKEIILVSHGGFLPYLTEDWEELEERQGTCWKNTEYRTYEFAEEAQYHDLEGCPVSDDNATLTETPESRQRRGKTGAVPTHE